MTSTMSNGKWKSNQKELYLHKCQQNKTMERGSGDRTPGQAQYYGLGRVITMHFKAQYYANLWKTHAYLEQRD